MERRKGLRESLPQVGTTEINTISPRKPMWLPQKPHMSRDHHGTFRDNSGSSCWSWLPPFPCYPHLPPPRRSFSGFGHQRPQIWKAVKEPESLFHVVSSVFPLTYINHKLPHPGTYTPRTGPKRVSLPNPAHAPLGLPWSGHPRVQLLPLKEPATQALSLRRGENRLDSRQVPLVHGRVTVAVSTEALECRPGGEQGMDSWAERAFICCQLDPDMGSEAGVLCLFLADVS